MITSQKVDNWWACKQCGRQFDMDSLARGYAVGGEGYYCEECFKSGITWAIAMAYKDARNGEKQ